MQRFIEFVETEFEIFAAVQSRRIRSLALFIAALVVPPILMLIALNVIGAGSIPGLEQGVRPVLSLFGLVLTLKFLFLSIQTYLKDRSALLSF